MVATGNSLRALVEKWIGPPPWTSARIIRLARLHSNHRRCLRIEASRSAGAMAIYLFLHDDGFWYVFPSEAGRPSMRVS